MQTVFKKEYGRGPQSYVWSSQGASLSKLQPPDWTRERVQGNIKPSDPVSSEVPVKLNLGCKTTRMEGYLGVDLDPSVNPDIVADVSNLEAIDSGSVSEIYASNVLEHFSHQKTLSVLKEWSRVLVPGGVLYLSVPDWDFCVNHYLRHRQLLPWLVYHMFGEQHEPLAWHYAIFNWPNLRALLHDAGFSQAEKLRMLPFSESQHEASGMRDSWDGEIISLNVKAVKGE